jgi:hypothetical protein
MPSIALQLSTIDLITERMKRDGYTSPDDLVREALASLKPPPTRSAETPPATAPDFGRNAPSNAEEDLGIETGTWQERSPTYIGDGPKRTAISAWSESMPPNGPINRDERCI